ncbi:DJ-1/PfpI family protein [Paraburkholderia sp. RL18-103-BIB-C]|uniref:GlxA family transcriptional regulator n=1 Tax=Paraburkholderia sp. RL18-103-BIB-C TaxID=3031637 RepID=UPI0038BBF30A
MRTVALVAFPGVQSRDVCGPLDVFAEANRFLLADSHYRVEVVGLEHGPLRCSNGMTISPDRHFSNTHDAYDLLLVAGGPGLARREFTDEIYAWLKRASRQARRFGSICSGAFILARAGLLDQRMVTTHGSHADELAALCPTARVEVDLPFVEDGNLCTSGGITAAVDLSLSLLKLDKGSEVALKVAERLVVSMERAGVKSQSSPHFTPYTQGSSWVAQVQQYVLSNLTGDLSVKDLARVTNMSMRTFARTFVRDAKISPAEYVVGARVDAARVMLQGTAIPLKTIAYECGFGNADRMRCVFQRCLGVSPKQYRLHYQSETCLDRELYAVDCHVQVSLPKAGSPGT